MTAHRDSPVSLDIVHGSPQTCAHCPTSGIGRLATPASANGGEWHSIVIPVAEPEGVTPPH